VVAAVALAVAAAWRRLPQPRTALVWVGGMLATAVLWVVQRTAQAAGAVMTAAAATAPLWTGLLALVAAGSAVAVLATRIRAHVGALTCGLATTCWAQPGAAASWDGRASVGRRRLSCLLPLRPLPAAQAALAPLRHPLMEGGGSVLLTSRREPRE
jgi:hypothetical protein